MTDLTKPAHMHTTVRHFHHHTIAVHVTPVQAMALRVIQEAFAARGLILRFVRCARARQSLNGSILPGQIYLLSVIRTWS